MDKKYNEITNMIHERQLKIFRLNSQVTNYNTVASVDHQLSQNLFVYKWYNV